MTMFGKGQHFNSGVHLSVWVSVEQAAKLDALAAGCGKTRSEVIRFLIDARPLPDQSYARLLQQLAKTGGLLKHLGTTGQDNKVFAQGREVVSIARRLKKESEDLYNADNNSQEDTR